MAEPRPETAFPRTRLALTLGGGGARGLAHIGVLEVLENEGIRPDFIVGSSMGGLIGALSSAGLTAREITEVARGFRFPRRFLPGGVLAWESLFGSAVRALSISFDQLAVSLAVTAVDLEAGCQVVLHTGEVLSAVRATCAVPGVMPPVKLGDHWLIDGASVNPLPVDVAWMSNPDNVVAVQVGAPRERRMPQLGWSVTALLSRLGRIIPNPATAKVSFEILVRAAEIAMARQVELAAAMTGPEVLIQPELQGVGLRDFHRLDDAIAAGRKAATAVLPDLLRRVESPTAPRPRSRTLSFSFDPVCSMIINPARARSSVEYRGEAFYFCSPNCRECFDRDPASYLERTGVSFSPPTGGCHVES